MPNFPEPITPAFVPVYQIQRTDPVDAGAAGEGPSNLPLKNLVERTAYLKKEVDALDTAVGGVVIGSTVQAYDPDLQAIAALNTNGVVARTGAGTAAIRPTGATGLDVLASADAAAARTAIDAAPLASPTFTGTVTASGATASTSTTTGALVVTGGVGVGGNLNVGMAINGLSILSGEKLSSNTSTTITITFDYYGWADISIYQNNTNLVNARAYKLNAGRRESSISENIVWQVQNDASAVWSGDDLVITIPHIVNSGNTSKFCSAIGARISNLTVV